MIGTFALHLLSGSHCLPLWALDCDLLAHYIHSLMNKVSARYKPLNNCFNKWRLIGIESGLLVCHLCSLL